jgi:hypothetical protein
VSDQPFRYQGFSRPNYTQVPDDVFDVLLPELTESELKVLLYIIRRTFGFKKDEDTISLKQMVEGIRTRDGRQLDRGAGVSKTSAVRGVNGLVEKGIILAVRNRSTEKGDEPTTYTLHFADAPVSRFETPPPLKLEQGPGPDLDPQQTVRQETDRQQVEDSNAPARLFAAYDEDRALLLAYAQDLARELNDQAPLNSTTTRLLNLYRGSGLDMDTFIARMLAARRVTQQRTAAIRTTRPDGGLGPKPKTAYFLAVLADMLGQELPATGTEDD